MPMRRFCRGLLLSSISLGSAIYWGASLSHSAPIEIGFKATVSEVDGDAAAITLPFSLSVGQQLKGRYSFDSEERLLEVFSYAFPNQQAKSGQLLLDVDSVIVGAGINTGSINFDLVEINGPPPVPSSSISLGYGNYFTDVFPGWGGQVAEYPYDTGLRLEGPVGTVLGVDDVLDVGIWNRLTTRRTLELVFGYFESNQFKVVSYTAIVGDFFTVPEPPTHVCFLIVVGFAAFAPRLRLNRHQ